MENNNKMVIYQTKVNPSVKRAIKNILLENTGEDLDQQFLRLIPVSRKKAELMKNLFIQEWYETHDIYLVDFCIGQKKGKEIWRPLTKIAVNQEMVEEAKAAVESAE